MVRKVLLFCGILAPLLRVATDVLAAMWYPGYSYIDQTMSQLAAIGAPTRPFQVALLALYSVLVIAFGIVVWRSAGRKKLTVRHGYSASHVRDSRARGVTVSPNSNAVERRFG
jgi:hypothetical membrane protein